MYLKGIDEFEFGHFERVRGIATMVFDDVQGLNDWDAALNAARESESESERVVRR